MSYNRLPKNKSIKIDQRCKDRLDEITEFLGKTHNDWILLAIESLYSEVILAKEECKEDGFIWKHNHKNDVY